MKIEYTVTLDDMVALYRQAAKDSPAIQRNRRINLWSGVVILLGLSLFEEYRHHRPYYWVVGALVAGAYYFFMKRFADSVGERNLRGIYAEGTHQGVIGKHALEISGDMLNDTTIVGCQSVQISSIDRVVETPSHYFIFLSAINAHAVPKAGVLGDAAGFMEQLRKGKGV